MNAFPKLIDLAEAGVFRDPVDVSLRAIEMAKSLYPFQCGRTEKEWPELNACLMEKRQGVELAALDRQFEAWKAEAEAGERMRRNLAWEESRRHHVGRDAL